MFPYIPSFSLYPKLRTKLCNLQSQGFEQGENISSERSKNPYCIKELLNLIEEILWISEQGTMSLEGKELEKRHFPQDKWEWRSLGLWGQDLGPTLQQQQLGRGSRGPWLCI